MPDGADLEQAAIWQAEIASAEPDFDADGNQTPRSVPSLLKIAAYAGDVPLYVLAHWALQ
ncbi:hypothetical protein [Ruegeria sp. A3M17]|uniref:hypothetical protein n=1 Tax=Ruegeria sp. A3M17 TaxID=2267229 RepID=UPI000DE9D6E4|nr:hypothetical protein [Ruegeria sp. A3M17]RBW63032.1 hypothetical protein DS906_01035 [Ruegeria sp. A3M17]